MRDYIIKNEKILFRDYKAWVNWNYNALSYEEIQDCFQTACLNVLKNKSSVKDCKAYFWITLRNTTKNFKMKKDKHPTESFNTEFEVVEFKDLEAFAPNGFNLLCSNLKIILTQPEYHFFLNYINNKMSYRRIAEEMGYSVHSIYNTSKICFKKVKNELINNREKYLNV